MSELRKTHIHASDLERKMLVVTLDGPRQIVDLCRWRGHTIFVLEGRDDEPWMRSDNDTVEVAWPEPTAEDYRAALEALSRLHYTFLLEDGTAQGAYRANDVESVLREHGIEFPRRDAPWLP